ncbi:MAG: chloride channel protein family [Desulfuromonadales bacterium]|nr:chloride channel protein family [Desulfuromonadales bacterium]
MAIRNSITPLRENTVALLLLAIFIGVATGALAVAFRYLLRFATNLCWRESYDLLRAAIHKRWYVVILTPAIGGLLIGPIIAKFAPETRGTGVPEVISAVVIRDGQIRHRTTLFKMLSSVISIGSGASVGREGPIVHIGASVGSSLAQVVKLSAEWRRVFLACGAAAGIAATFNAPMAGMLFATEIILVDFQISYLSHIAVSTVTATVVSHHFLGRLPTFDVPIFRLGSYWEIPLYFLLGLLAGGIALLFIRSISLIEDAFDRSRLPIFVRPAIGGLCVGLMAIGWPHVLGVGYQTVNLVLAAKVTLITMTIVVVLKLVATAVSVGSGFSGGIFAPSLVLGALLGGLVGWSANMLWPEQATSLPGYALVGMGALVSGATLAPITAIFTIFELTYSFEIILPLMISCIGSLLVVQKFSGFSVYEVGLLRQGVKIRRGRDLNLLRSMRVVDYMEKEFETVRTDTHLGELIQKVQESPYPHFLVMDEQNELVGMLSLRDLQSVLTDIGDLCELVVASEIMTSHVFHIFPEDNLEKAFEVFEGKQISTLPVVNPFSPRQVLGVLKKDRLLHVYNEKILKTGVLYKIPS